MLYIGKELCDVTLCSKISAYQVMLPKALKASSTTNIGIKKNRYIVSNVSVDELDDYISKCRYENQINILNELREKNKILLKNKVTGVDTLIKKGIIKLEYEEMFRYNTSASGRYRVVTLNEEQQKKTQ